MDRLSYGAFLAVQWLFRLLPLAAVARLGGLGGRVFFLCSRTYRSLAARNLHIAYAGEMTDGERRALLWRHAATLGANLACSVKLPCMSKDAIAPHVEVTGYEHMEAASADGRGVVCVISHMGPWELFTHTREYIPPGRPAGAIYQALSNPLLDTMVRASREQMHHQLFERGDGFFAAIALLKQGGLVGVLSDQHAGDAGVFAPFFGRLASSTTLPLLLARKAKAGAVTIGIRTTGLARWQIYVGPLEIPPRGDAANALPALNLALEAMIRRSPADWFWVHNRWKTPEPAFLLHAHKRGIMMPADGSKVKPFRVVLRSPNWLGDACMAVPAVRAIKRGRPDMELTVLAPAKLADMWLTVPEVDEVIGRDGKESVFGVARKLRAAGPFDVGILFPNSPRVAMEMWFGGIDRVMGYATAGRGLLLDQVVRRKDNNGPPRHHVEHYLQIAHVLGADCGQIDIFDPLPGQDAAASTGGPLRLGLCAGAEYGPAKRWPLDKFATMAKLVHDRHGDAVEWVLFGAPGEKTMGGELAGMLGGNCHNLVGQTTLAGLISALRGCRLLVSNDTGTMHLAALLGVPVIAIFGSTEPAWTRPLGRHHVILREHVECSPCFLRECPLDLRCMHAITPESVATAVAAMLAT